MSTDLLICQLFQRLLSDNRTAEQDAPTLDVMYALSKHPAVQRMLECGQRIVDRREPGEE
jgi:hypothetical protein